MQCNFSVVRGKNFVLELLFCKKKYEVASTMHSFPNMENRTELSAKEYSGMS